VSRSGPAGSPVLRDRAGLPSLPRSLAEARSYAERLFDYWPIGALERADAAAALIKPGLDAGVEWEPAAVDLVTSPLGRVPVLPAGVRQGDVGLRARPSITSADAIVGIQVGMDNLDHGFFKSRWERATAAERSYMRAMAAGGETRASRAPWPDGWGRSCRPSVRRGGA
jgi:hypothetical protein